MSFLDPLPFRLFRLPVADTGRGRRVTYGLADRVYQRSECLFRPVYYLRVVNRGSQRLTQSLGRVDESIPSLTQLLLGAFLIGPGESRPYKVAEFRKPGSHMLPGGLRFVTVSNIVHMNLHLLDATYELFRAYFGFPRRQAPDGTEVGAVYGIIETTLQLLRQDGVTHLAAATDAVIESFRNQLFEGYKTGEGVPPDLFNQFPLAEEALEALGVTVWAMREFEADDAIATGALRWADAVDRVVILSPDKDLMQCVIGDRVVTYNRRARQLYDEDGVVEKFGILPTSIPDYLALVGDSADGVPGIAGWGAKSTSTVLARYGRIERIPKSSIVWDIKVRGAARLSANLEAARPQALLYRTLTTLRRDVPLGQTLGDLEWRGAHRDRFAGLCDRLGFRRLSRRPHRWSEPDRSG